jgi:hypothetical protein
MLASVASPVPGPIGGPKSLTGDCLLGEMVMRLVYVDEAGISNRVQEPFLTVAGVIVHADKDLIAVERQLDKLVEKHIPSEYHDGFVFHAMEIFNGGRKPFDRDDPDWPLSRRLKIAEDLAAIPARFRLPLALSFVERAEFGKTIEKLDEAPPADRAVLEHVAGFMGCAMQVEHWMRQNAPDEVCLMVVEDNDRARRLIRETQQYHQQPALAAMLEPEPGRHFPFRKIKEDPHFQAKRKSSVLQLADFAAYVFKRITMNESDSRYAPFYEAMRRQVVRLDPESLVQLSARNHHPLNSRRSRGRSR